MPPPLDSNKSLQMTKNVPFRSRRLSITWSASAIASLLVLGSISAQADEFTYRYFRFKATKIKDNGNVVQMSEFTFSHDGKVLNTNDRDGSGVEPIELIVTTNGIDASHHEGPPKLVDGRLDTKLFRGSAMVEGNEIVFDFTTPRTVDGYNFATANDNAELDRTPVSWVLSGSMDKKSWTPIDVREDIPVIDVNYTYYPGFTILGTDFPIIEKFSIRNTATEGTSAIVLNGESLTLDYDVSNSQQRRLFQGGDSIELEAEAGAREVVPPPHTTSAYNLVATKEGFKDAVSTVTVRSVAGGPVSYRSVRYTVTGRRGGGRDPIQLSEMEFFNGDANQSENKLQILSSENPGGRNPVTDAEGANKLFDGNPMTKWLDADINRPVVFHFGEDPVTFDRYQFITGNDVPERDPVTWTLEGSNDDANWQLIELVDFVYPTPTTRNFSSRTIPLPGASLPVTLSLTGTASKLIVGETLTLVYSIVGLNPAMDAVVLKASTGEVMPAIDGAAGVIEVIPTQDTLYTLELTRVGGVDRVSPEVAVRVVSNPGVDQIVYEDFSSAGSELNSVGSTAITGADHALPNRLRLTPDQGSQKGAAWFMQKFNINGGFEATFGLHMNAVPHADHPPADGIAFVIQDSPAGNGELGTGETGVTENALSICFRSFGTSPDPASLIEVRNGTTVLDRCVAYNQPGVELHGMPGVRGDDGVVRGEYPFTLASLATDPAYRIRVVYMPGDLDVYLDGIAVIQNLEVNIADFAADWNGKSYFGFTARTGGYSQNNDITDWKVKFGNFSHLPPFGMVKTRFKASTESGALDTIDVVWNASKNKDYELVRSSDLALPLEAWEALKSEFGEDGQIGVSVRFGVGSPAPDKSFFSVREKDQ
jgi:hypothetical protein